MEWIVYNADAKRIAMFVHAEDAAAFVGIIGDGATVRHGRRIVWREGSEDESAAESYDGAAERMRDRIACNGHPGNGAAIYCDGSCRTAI